MENAILELSEIFQILEIDPSTIKVGSNDEINLIKDDFNNFYLQKNFGETKFIIKCIDFNPLIGISYSLKVEVNFIEPQKELIKTLSEIFGNYSPENFNFCEVVACETTLFINYSTSIYPQILFSKELINLCIHRISSDKVPEILGIEKPKFIYKNQPNKPAKSKIIEAKKLVWEGNNVLIGVLVIIIIVPFLIKIYLLGFIFTLWLVFLLIDGFKYRNCSLEVDLDKNQYNHLIDEYEKNVIKIKEQNKFKKEEYEKELKLYNQKIQDLRVIAENTVFKKNLLSNNDYLKNTCNNSRGKSEVHFLKFLKDEIKDVLIDISVNLENKYYEPDFTIFCKETGLHLDIEIDEPYSFLNGELLHHDRSLDSKRNEAFLKNRWGIIRFSEKQIIKYPKACVKLIEQVLYSIKNKNLIVNFRGPIEERWTYEEALLMANNNYRNTYLPKEMQKVLEKKYVRPEILSRKFLSNDGLPF